MSDLPIIFLLLLIVAVLLRVDFVSYIAYVLAGIYVLAHWRTGMSLRRLRVSRHFTDHVFLGETVGVELEIANTSWWPLPWLRCEETPPIALTTGDAIRQVVTLGPKERIHLRYAFGAVRRGYYEIGPTLLAAGDPFGFAEARGQVDLPAHLTVYPRVIPLGQVELASRVPHGAIKSRQPIFTDPARVAGKRPYAAGDPLRSIDWKSSAHLGALQVRKFDPAVSLSTIICLDMNAEAYGRQLRIQASEWGVTVAASLANYLAEQRQAVGVASNGADPLTGARGWSIPPRSGRPHLMKLLEWLARVELADTTPLVAWLPAATVDLAWGTTVIVISPSGDAAICQGLHRLVRAGLNPVLAVVEPHGQFGLVRERAQRLGIAAHLVADEHDLDAWRPRRPGL